jgi:Uma2 family endonuclease
VPEVHATFDSMQGDPRLEPEIPVAPPGEHELPSNDGEPMESNEHRLQMVLLIQSLKEAWAEREDFFVAGNMFVYFSEHQVKKNDFRGPDVFVVLGASRRSRRCWVAWGEGGKLPDVVIELLSDRTRDVDRGEKMRIYSRIWRTAEYFLYDPISHEFEGYRLDPTTLDYQPIAADGRGDLKSEALKLGLGIREGTCEDVEGRWLRWLDDGGRPLVTPQERARAAQWRADAEHRRAETERARADALEARVRELEAKLSSNR